MAQQWDEDLAAFIDHLEEQSPTDWEALADAAKQAGISPLQMWCRLAVQAAGQTGLSPKEIGRQINEQKERKDHDQ